MYSNTFSGRVWPYCSIWSISGNGLIRKGDKYQKERTMDENNTNGLSDMDDFEEGTTILTTPGVSAVSHAQNDQNQTQYGGFVQPGQQPERMQYNGWNQPGQQMQPGGWNQPNPQMQPGNWNQPNPQMQPGNWNQPNPQMQPGGWNQPDSQMQQGGWNQPNPQMQPGGWNQPNPQMQPGGWTQPDPQAQPGNWTQPNPQNTWGQPYAQPDPQFNMTPGNMEPGRKINKKIIALIAGIAVAVVIIIIALVLLLSGGRGARSAAKIGDKLTDAYEKGDADAMVDLMSEDYYKLYDKAMSYMGMSGSDYVKDTFDTQVSDMVDEVGKVKEIKIEDRSEKEYKDDEIDNVNSTLDLLNVDMKVDKCLEIDMTVKIKGSEDSADGNIVYTAIKSGSRWYLVDYELDID